MEELKMKSRSIQLFWELFYLKGLNNKEHILIEAIRAVAVYRHVLQQGIQFSSSIDDQEQLFQEMKQLSDKYKLGHFPGDREFFYQLFCLADKLDLLELLVLMNRDDRTGIVLAPDYLLDYLSNGLANVRGKILIAEAEKLAEKLYDIIKSNRDNEFVLTTDNYSMYLLMSTVFAEFDHVKVIHQSIYRELFMNERFDCIFCIPAFGGRLTPEEVGNRFLSRDSECIAIENLLYFLQDGGKLISVLPAKITFGSGSVGEFRRWLLDNYRVNSIYSLPEGTFRPYVSIKTYVMGFTKADAEEVSIGRLENEEYQLVLRQGRTISYEEFRRHEDWRIELFFPDDNEEIQRFKASRLEKVRLKEVAEIFRGKSVMKDDIQPGKIGVVNISNIEDGKILLDKLDTVQDEERKVKRYQLFKDDLVLTCRGTVNKVAAFPATERIVIASANIIVIRLTEKLTAAYVKVFLESPIGQTLVKSFQRGTTVMNINPSDIGELEIPILPLEKQNQIVAEFETRYKKYRQAIDDIEQKWTTERENIYNHFIDGGE